MPGGDTLAKTAAVLREILGGRVVRSARGRPGGPPLERLAGVGLRPNRPAVPALRNAHPEPGRGPARATRLLVPRVPATRLEGLQGTPV